MSDAYTRDELDKLTCSTAGCDHKSHDGLVLYPMCHRKSSVSARYWGDGAIEVRCHTCNKMVTSIALHPEEQVIANAKLSCNDPECKEPPENHCLAFKHLCHPKAGMHITYADGHLALACARCAKVCSTHHVKEKTALA